MLEKGRGRPRHTRRCRTVAAPRAAALWPTHPLSYLCTPHLGTLCVVGGASRSVHKREIRWRGFYPHHLSRVNKKTKPLQSGGASFGAVVHFCAQKMRVRQKHELWPNLQICPPEQLAREPPVGRGGHSPDFSRLVSPKGAHCESSELGLGTEICLNWLARRDNMGVSTQADCETLNGVLTFPFTRELNTRSFHLPTCTLDSRQASKRTFANTRQTSKTADNTRLARAHHLSAGPLLPRTLAALLRAALPCTPRVSWS